MTWIIDGHQDLAFNAVALQRELRLPVDEIRQAEGGIPPHGEGVATVSLPALRTADVRIVVATLFTAPFNPAHAAAWGYHTPDEAHRQALAQLAYYQLLHEEHAATLIRSRPELERVVERQAPYPGLLVLMEGAAPLRTPADLVEFAERGVRLIGLSWRKTRYAGSASEPGPLTVEGQELLQEMARLGIALDISHLAEEAGWRALEAFPGNVVASHANCRAIVPGERQLSDDQLRAVAERDGVIGLVCYNRFIKPEWRPEMGKEAVGLADLMAHARHIAELIGVRHLALGSDLDGGIGFAEVPREIDSAADLAKLAGAFADAGFNAEEISAILHGNWMRVLRRLFI